MIVLQNDINASEKSIAELEQRLTADDCLMVRFELDDLAGSVLGLGQKLIETPRRFKTPTVSESELRALEDDWAVVVQAMERLTVHALEIIGRFERSKRGNAIDSKPQLQRLYQHLHAINSFPLSAVRQARRDLREGRLTPLSAVKDALSN